MAAVTFLPPAATVWAMSALQMEEAGVLAGMLPVVICSCTLFWAALQAEVPAVSLSMEK